MPLLVASSMSETDECDLPFFNDVTRTKKLRVSLSSVDSEPIKPSVTDNDKLDEADDSESERPPVQNISLGEEIIRSLEEREGILKGGVIDLNRVSQAPIAVLTSVNHKEAVGLAEVFNGAFTLDKGAVLCLCDGTIIGHVALVFGPVCQPMYAIQIPPSVLSTAVEGLELHYDVSRATVFFDPRNQCDAAKGTDASYVNDDELPDFVRPDFSDDEEELQWKRSRGKTHTTEPVSSEDEPMEVAWSSIEWSEVA